MTGIAVVGQDKAGGIHLGGGQTFVTVGGSLVVLLGDKVTPHGKKKHMAPVMVQGTSWYRINGIPVVHAGHEATCGHVSSGRPWYRINV